MKIHLVFLESFHVDVYNEESMHTVKDFVKRSQKKNLRVQSILKFCFFQINTRIVHLIRPRPLSLPQHRTRKFHFVVPNVVADTAPIHNLVHTILFSTNCTVGLTLLRIKILPLKFNNLFSMLFTSSAFTAP